MKRKKTFCTHKYVSTTDIVSSRVVFTAFSYHGIINQACSDFAYSFRYFQSPLGTQHLLILSRV
jgi:hypothetical protein